MCLISGQVLFLMIQKFRASEMIHLHNKLNTII